MNTRVKSGNKTGYLSCPVGEASRTEPLDRSDGAGPAVKGFQWDKTGHLTRGCSRQDRTRQQKDFHVMFRKSCKIKERP